MAEETVDEVVAEIARIGVATGSGATLLGCAPAWAKRLTAALERERAAYVVHFEGGYVKESVHVLGEKGSAFFEAAKDYCGYSQRPIGNSAFDAGMARAASGSKNRLLSAYRSMTDET